LQRVNLTLLVPLISTLVITLHDVRIAICITRVMT